MSSGTRRQRLQAKLQTELPWLLAAIVMAAAMYRMVPDYIDRTPRLISVAIMVGAATFLRVTYKYLKPKVGAATTWVALLAISAVLPGLFFAISPECYATQEGGRCSPAELGQWMSVGLMMSTVLLMFSVIPYATIRGTYRLTRRILARFNVLELPESMRLADEQKKAARNQDPVQPAEVTVEQKNEATKLSRSGNPAKRAQAAQLLNKQEDNTKTDIEEVVS